MPVPMLSPSTSTIYPPLWCGGLVAGQLDHDHVAHPRAHYLFRRDQDIEAQAAVVRDDKADASVGEVTANYLAGFGTRTRTMRASRRPLRSAPSG